MLALAAIVATASHIGGQAASTRDPDARQVPAPPPNRSSAPARELPNDVLLAELRKGGLALYFRHSATNFRENDKASRGFEDCANQRNLIDRGRADARAIGRAIEDLKIPIERVLASPMCRTMETARLIFGRAEPSLEVRAQGRASSAGERYSPLKKLLATPQPTGANLAIVSHGNPFHGVAGPPFLMEGEAAVIRGVGDDFEVIGRIRPDEWSRFGR